MSEIRVEFKGWKAIVAVISIVTLLLGASRLRYGRALRDVEGAERVLQGYLLNRATSEHLPGLREAASGNLERREAESRIEEALEDFDVRIEEFELRGTILGGAVCRVRYTVGGETPEDGGERHFSLEYETGLGWLDGQVYEINPVFFRLAVWR